MELNLDHLKSVKSVKLHNLTDEVKDSLPSIQEQIVAEATFDKFISLYKKGLDNGELTPVEFEYKHHFTTVHEDFGCALYGREMHLKKGTIVIGAKHKHPSIIVLLKGKIAVVSQMGRRVLKAPCIFASDPGLRRIGFVLEDCVWANVIATAHVGEDNLSKIEEHHTVVPPKIEN
jgi:hypothetical protein